MFKRLKEKVENVESLEKNAPSPPSTRQNLTVGDRVRGKWKSDNKLQAVDATSPNGSENDTQTESSKEDLLTTLMQRTVQVKRLENKLADYGQSLKECSKERDKLVLTLEKQQDTAMLRQSEVEDSYSEERKKMGRTISDLEKREASLTEAVERLNQENGKLQISLEVCQKDNEDLKKKIDNFFMKHENSEEMNDLQMQEMAKIKHMLMKSEKECKRYQEGLDLKVAELLECRDTRAGMESSLRITTESLNSSREQLEILIQANHKLSIDLATSEGNISALQQENSDSSKKISSLTADLDQATMNLEEKEQVLKCFKKKVSSLEQRIMMETLPENEQLRALTLEKTALENRLEECQQQLNNVKYTWSSKINKLEQQVSHLNGEIAEDWEEMSNKNKELGELEASSKKEIEISKAQLQRLEEQLEQNYLQRVAKLEADFVEKHATHELECSRLEKNTEEVNIKAKMTESQLRKQIEQLLELQSDYDKRIKHLESELSKSRASGSSNVIQIQELKIELASKLTEMANQRCAGEKIFHALEETRHSRDTIAGKYEKLVGEYEELEMRLQDTEKRLIEFNAHKSYVSNPQSDKAVGERKFQNHSSQLESMAEKISDERRDEEEYVHERNELVHQKEFSLQSRGEEWVNGKEQSVTSRLRNNHTEEVCILQAEKSKIEEKIAERDRLIKVQQQMLNDLKKALNKELNKSGSGTMNANISTTAGGTMELQVDGTGSSPLLKVRKGIPERPALGTTLIDDQSLSVEQREVTLKYLKNVLFTFLSCEHSEAQQLVKAMSMLFTFNKDEEKFLKDILNYRASWFGSKPSTKKMNRSFTKQERR